jgi:hypothetical protein
MKWNQGGEPFPPDYDQKKIMGESTGYGHYVVAYPIAQPYIYEKKHNVYLLCNLKRQFTWFVL